MQSLIFSTLLRPLGTMSTKQNLLNKEDISDRQTEPLTKDTSPVEEESLKTNNTSKMGNQPSTGSTVPPAEPGLINHYPSKSQLSVSAASMFCSSTTINAHFVDAISVYTDIDDVSSTKQSDSKQETIFQKLYSRIATSVLLRSVSFWVLVVFFFCAQCGETVPQVYIPALAREKGLSRDQSATLLSVMNLLDIPGDIFVLIRLLSTIYVPPVTGAS